MWRMFILYGVDTKRLFGIFLDLVMDMCASKSDTSAPSCDGSPTCFGEAAIFRGAAPPVPRPVVVVEVGAQDLAQLRVDQLAR